MKTLLIAALLVLTIAGCSTWGTGMFNQQRDGAGGLSPFPTPTPFNADD